MVHEILANKSAIQGNILSIFQPSFLGLSFLFLVLCLLFLLMTPTGTMCQRRSLYVPAV